MWRLLLRLLVVVVVVLLLLQVAFASCRDIPGCTNSGTPQQPSLWRTSSTP
jgi:hypothetical protein